MELGQNLGRSKKETKKRITLPEKNRKAGLNPRKRNRKRLWKEIKPRFSWQGILMCSMTDIWEGRSPIY